jgi:hypothetical protein
VAVDPVLFTVVLDTSKSEVTRSYVSAVSRKLEATFQELLSIVGHVGRVSSSFGQQGDRWHLSLRVPQKFISQLDLFSANTVRSNQAAASEIIRAALVAISQFRRETRGVHVAGIEELLAKLKSADPRIINALSKHPQGITVRNDLGQVELRLHSDPTEKIDSAPERVRGVIVAVGPKEMALVPLQRRRGHHLAKHTIRVKVPIGLQAEFDDLRIRGEMILTGKVVELRVVPEQLRAKRSKRSCFLIAWPPVESR